jgi:hypothetical protein
MTGMILVLLGRLALPSVRDRMTRGQDRIGKDGAGRPLNRVARHVRTMSVPKLRLFETGRAHEIKSSCAAGSPNRLNMRLKTMIEATGHVVPPGWGPGRVSSVRPASGPRLLPTSAARRLLGKCQRAEKTGRVCACAAPRLQNAKIRHKPDLISPFDSTAVADWCE